MRVTAIIGLLLVIVLVSLSSYLRLDHSGVGCTPWPDCYGNIGLKQDEAGVQQAYERLVAEARQPMSWARPMHRLVASVLGLLVLGFAGYSLIAKRQRLLSFGLLGLTVFLAWIGIYSEGLHSPAIVMGNLGGGFAMLGMLGWIVFESGPRLVDSNGHCRLQRFVTVAIVVLILQILIGGLTSANFAASACSTLPHCYGEWLPGSELWAALDLSRSIEVNEQGVVAGGTERAAIHMLHRIVSIFTVIAVIVAGVLASRADPRLVGLGGFLCFLVIVEMSLGIAAVRTGIPIAVAVSHNWLAGLLLLGLLKLRVESSGQPASADLTLEANA